MLQSSKTYKKPLLIVFAKIFYFNENFEFVWPLNENSKKNEDIKLKQWFQYWEENGNTLILDDWNKKYGEYLQSPEEEINNCLQIEKDIESFKSSDLDSDSENFESLKRENTVVDNSFQVADEWQIIWDEHCLDVCNKQYHYFETIYSNYCSLYSPNIEFQSNQESNLILNIDPNEELHVIQSLGLPVAFGKQNKQNYNKLEQINYDSEINNIFSDEDQNEDNDYFSHNFDEMKIESDTTEDSNSTEMESTSKEIKKKKNNKKKLKNIPKSILEDKYLIKYWRKRFNLFSRYDEGIKLDKESWFSVTPEKIALNLAQRLKCDVLIDGFCGCGGNAIQFAMTCHRVIAIDIDPEKIQMARHNAKIYGVENKIDFIIGDFLLLCSKLKGDIVFLSPPWGGPKYKKNAVYDIEQSLLPIPATQLIEKCKGITNNIAFFLPKNSNMEQIIKMAGNGNRVEVKHFYLEDRLVAISAIYGENIISD